MKTTLALAPFVFVCAAAAASAQVVVSGNSGLGMSYTWRIDAATGERTILFPGAWSGIGIDDPNGRMYLCQASWQLYEWDYGSSSPPHVIGLVTNASGQLIAGDALAFGGGQLFCSAGWNYAQTKGVYRIDLNTFVGAPITLNPPQTTVPDNLAFNPLDGMFYGFLDYNETPSPGLYRYDLLGNGAVAQIASQPTLGSGDVDGLAIGNGRAYLLGDDSLPFAIWDFATLSYVPASLPSPFAVDCIQSGGDWAQSLNVQSQPQVYCDGKRNSNHCTPMLVWTGDASASAAGPFELHARNVLANVNCGLVYSLAGPASTPFGGGTLCVAAPLQRVQMLPIGGNAPPCGGDAKFEFNAYVASGANPSLIAGQTVWMQIVSRDPGFAQPNNLGLSPALRAVIKP